MAILTLYCAVSGHAKTLNPQEERRAWKTLLSRTAESPLPETLNALRQYLQTYPDGDQARHARFGIAETLFNDGQYEQALVYYQALIENKDGVYFGDSLLRAGEIFYNTKRLSEAKKTWQRALEKTPGHSLVAAEALYGLALCELSNKNYLGADKIIDRLLDDFPSYAHLPKVRELIGLLRFQEKNYTEALEALEGIATPHALLFRGLSAFNQKHYLEAANLFHDLEASTGAYGEIGSYFKAECFRMAQNPVLAEQAYDEFTRRYPESRLKAYALAEKSAFLTQLGKLDEALAHLEMVAGLRPSADLLAYTLYLKANVFARKGDSSKTLALFDQALSVLPAKSMDLSAHIRVAKAHYLIQGERWAEATATVQELVADTAYHPLGLVAHLLSGIHASLRGQWEKALTAYETAFMKYPYGPLSDVAMGMMLSAYYRAGRFQELVTHSNRIVQTVGKNFSSSNLFWRSYSHLLIAESYYKLRLYSEASQAYQETLKDPALAPLARLYLAWSRYHEGRYSDSIRLTKQILASRGYSVRERASAHFLMAGSYFNQKKYEPAIQTFRSFRQSFPNDPRVAESWLQEGWAQQMSGYPGDALEAWHKLAKLFPQSPLAQEAVLQEGKLYFQAGQYAKAAKTYANFLSLWPDSPMASDARWSMAQSHYNSGLFAQAIKAYREFADRYETDARAEDARNQIMLSAYRFAAQSRDPKQLSRFVELYPRSQQAPEAQNAVARIFFERKDWPKAIEAFRKLLLDYPGTSHSPSALVAVAEAQEHLKKPEEAIKEYESLLTLFPANPLAIDAAMRLGAIHFNGKRYADAARSFRFVVEREAADDLKADALYNLAVCYKRNRDYDEALKIFEQFANSRASDPRRVGALLEMASIHSSRSQNENAVAVYQRILAFHNLEPAKRMSVHNRIGEIYRNLGEREKAIEAYSPLLNLKPANLEPRLLGLAQLAALYEEVESWEKALEAYQQIESSGGRADWIKAALKRRREIQAFLKTQKGAQTAALFSN
ncbi:MAG: tetratricopeptide repeat protein [Elusimicrobia bacterium]|nr:tetratricopeptide repeat protein [Elusimicrobiota bacterium]